MKKLLLALFLLPSLVCAQTTVRVWDGSRLAGVKETGSADSLQCAIVDGSGNQITSFGSSVVTANQGTPGPAWPVNIVGTPAAAIPVSDNAGSITVDGTLAVYTPAANWPVSIAATPAAAIPISGTTNTGQLVWISSASSDVDNTNVLVFDCSGASSSSKAITIANAGEGDLFCRVGGTDAVADGSTAYYDYKLAKGETRWIPAAYKASSTDNDVKCLRAGAQTNDNVIVALWGWAS